MKEEFCIERPGDGSAFLLFTPGAAPLDQTALGMLEHNQIPGLLPVCRSQLDAAPTLRYPVTGLVSGAEFLARQVTRRGLLRYLECVCQAVQSAEEYLLDPSMLCLDSDVIFCVPARGEARLVYLPLGSQRPPDVDLCGFFRRTLREAKCPLDEDRSYTVELLRLLEQQTFTLEGFQAALGRLQQAGPAAPPPAEGVRPAGPEAPPTAPPPADPALRYEGTVLLEDPPPAPAVLIRQKTGEHFPIRGSALLVGRGPEAGCRVADNMAVSSRHLQIFSREDRFWAVDLGSTNGTFLNGVPLTPHAEVPLTPGCVLMVANEFFQFVV